MSFEHLNQRICEVTFLKLDGTERVMLCTKNLGLIPEDHHPTGEHSVSTKINLHRVYDVEKGAWRSFNEDQVIMFNYGD